MILFFEITLKNNFREMLDLIQTLPDYNQGEISMDVSGEGEFEFLFQYKEFLMRHDGGSTVKFYCLSKRCHKKITVDLLNQIFKQLELVYDRKFLMKNSHFY